VITKHSLALELVPYADCDPSGFAHHTRLIEYCERARIAMFEVNGVTINAALEWGYYIATGKVNASFHRPVRPGDAVVIVTEIKHFNTMKIVTGHEVLVGEQLAASVECTTVFLDEYLKPKQLPEAVWKGEWNSETIKSFAKSGPLEGENKQACNEVGEC
jgi:YbgC/YbaW family acyl-CoA thioester hydrolase